MANYRFIGSRAYLPEENHFFFGRQSIAERLYQNLLIEQTAVLFGPAGSGKTSLLNAGISPLLINSGRFEIIRLDFADSENIFAQFNTECERQFPQMSYPDKLVGKQEHVWYFLKKIQAQTPKVIVLLIDNFDLGLNTETGKKFRNQLKDTLSGNMPREFAEDAEKNRINLNKKGLELLDTTPEIKMIWAARPEAEKQINSLKNDFGFNPKNSAFIKDLPLPKIKLILTKTAEYQSPYKDRNSFKTKAFSFSKSLIERIMHESENRSFNTADLQIIGRQAEETAAELKIPELPDDQRFGLKRCSRQFFEKEILPLCNLNPQYADFLQYITRLPDDAAVPFKNIPQGFNENFTGIIESFKASEENARFFRIKSHLLQEYLNEFIAEYNEKTQADTTAEPKQNSSSSPTENKRYKKKLRYFQAASLLLIILASFGLLLVNKARKKAQDNKQLALSNMYAAYSYKNAENDPTLSFRYAQKAYEHYPANHEAYSALLNAYYNTEVFYSLIGKLPQNRREATLSLDGRYIMAFTDEAENKYTQVSLHKQNGEIIKTFNNGNAVFFAGFSKDSRNALFADAKGKLYIHDISREKNRSIQAAQSRILHVESPENGSFLVLSEDELSLLSETGEHLLRFPEHEFPYDMACLSADGKLTAAGTDSDIFIYNSRGDMHGKFKLSTGAGIKYPRITAMSFSPQNNKLLIVINDMLTKASQIIVSDLNGKILMKYGGHKEWIRTAKFSPDGTHIVSASYDKTSVVIDLQGNVSGILKGHKAFVSDAVFGENNEKVLSVSDDAAVRQWTFGRLINPLAEIQNIDLAIFAPYGLKMLTANDTFLSLRNIFGEPEVQFDTQGRKIEFADFANQSKQIYGLTDKKEIFFWSAEGEITHKLTSVPAQNRFLDFFADSSFVLTTNSDSTVVVRKLQTNEIVHRFKAQTKINHACFNDKNATILTAEESGKIFLRKPDGKIIKEFEGHDFGAQKAVFSPDGSKILTAGADKTAKLWTTKGELLHSFPAYNNKINSIEFSPDNRFILIAADDKEVTLYTVEGQYTGAVPYPGKTRHSVFSADGDYILTLYSNYGKNTAKLRHISPEIILRYVNDDKIFGDIEQFDIE